MHARHAWRRRRLTYPSIVLAGLVVGCGGKSDDKSDATAPTNPKAGARRNEMADFMKNQSPDNSSGTPRNRP